MKAYFTDTDYGNVEVHLRRGMRNITVKRKDTHLLVTAPLGLTGKEIIDAFNQMKPRLGLLKQQQVKYHLGQIIQCFGCSVTIAVGPQVKGGVVYGNHSATASYIHVPSDMDFQTFSAQKTISEALKKLMKKSAPALLIPYARRVAAELQVPCGTITVGSGLRKLGHCTSTNDIRLSANIMFLPEALVRYVICHELAHVTHHDHSSAFHALVDQYTDGQEKQLEAQLRAFNWPILR